MFDYHVHSEISFDAHSPMEEVAAAAAARGLTEICLTEHMDLDPAGVSHAFELDFARYDAAYARLMEEGTAIPVRQGMEMGVFAERAAEFEVFAREHDYDFIICSQHFSRGLDPYYPEFYVGRTMQEAYSGYLEDMLATLRVYKGYDIVGHIGYPSKYYRGSEYCKFDYDVYRDLLDEILRLVVADGKGIEANTSSIATTGDTVATTDMLRRFRELGGEVVTLGSDAHWARDVGQHFPWAMEMLKSVGFKYICSFEKRRPIFHKLP